MADLAQIARDVARVPQTATRAAAADTAIAAGRAGGTMRWHGRIVSLDAEVRSRSTSSGATSTVIGTPAGAWAIKNNGRRGGYRARADRGSALSLGGGRFYAAVTIRRGTSGDRRWDRVAAGAADALEDATAAAVARAVG